MSVRLRLKPNILNDNSMYVSVYIRTRVAMLFFIYINKCMCETPNSLPCDSSFSRQIQRHCRRREEDLCGASAAVGAVKRRKSGFVHILGHPENTGFFFTPESFRHGVTVLIPKSSDGVESKQFRLITMGPILCRLYH